MSTVLAADIGGTNVRLALIDGSGAILAEQRIEAKLSSRQQDSRAQAEDEVIETLRSAFSPFLESHPVQRIGIGFPGFFLGNSGVLAASPNLPMLNDFALAERLSASLGVAVFAQNDALCAAIGEHRFGAGKGCEQLLHITLGTGVGGGLILHGEPYSGERGMAMEFGHLRVEPDGGRSCGCGNSGCVEAYASATAVSERFSEASGYQADAKQVYQLACDGNREAACILNEAGSYLGRAIAEAIKLLDIGTVTISGGLIHAWSFIHPSLMQELNRNLIPPLRGKVSVIRSTLEDRAGLLGAASIALQG